MGDVVSLWLDGAVLYTLQDLNGKKSEKCTDHRKKDEITDRECH
jgi:hypothetical protein